MLSSGSSSHTHEAVKGDKVATGSRRHRDSGRTQYQEGCHGLGRALRGRLVVRQRHHRRGTCCGRRLRLRRDVIRLALSHGLCSELLEVGVVESLIDGLCRRAKTIYSGSC